MLASAEDWRNPRPRVHEIMLDLDRRCGHTLVPILPMMEPVYRLEGR